MAHRSFPARISPAPARRGTCWILAAACLAAAAWGGEAPAARRKVILLGFDGADPALCERWMSERDPATGRPWLEHLARLKERGSFARLQTTFPAQTPVAWACAACSANPGVTSIADFVGRDPKTMRMYLTLGAAEEREFLCAPGWRWAAAGLLGLLAALGAYVLHGWLCRPRGRRRAGLALALGLGLAVALAAGYAASAWIPARLAWPRNLRQGTPLWEAAGAAGARAVFLKFPLTFPAEQAPGLSMLAGFGVPDATGAPYTWTRFGPDVQAERRTETYGTLKPWLTRDGRLTGQIEGPPNPLDGGRHVAIPVAWSGDGRLSIGDAEAQALAPGAWSEPFRFGVSFSPLASVRLTLRALRLDGPPGLPAILVGPPQFDPAAPPPNIPLSSPPGYAAALARDCGTYNTAGWDVATHPAKDGWLDDGPFLKDVAYAFERDGALFSHELARGDWDLLCAVFMETDRAAHILWRHLSPTHPLHDPGRAAAGTADLRAVYRTMDRLVGEALARADALSADLLVVSDHGFAAFDTQVHLNAVLRDAGLLTRKQGAVAADARQVESGENLDRIDFARTQAYALGLGGIFMNLKNRECSGTVREEERELVSGLIEQALLRLTDPRTGRKVVRRVVRNEAVYRGPHAGLLPDFLVCFEPGYRVSWATAVGGVPDPALEPNRSAWSGDHCSVEPEEVPGVLFTSRLLPAGLKPALLDLAPTVLERMGLPQPEQAGWEGHAFWKP